MSVTEEKKPSKWSEFFTQTKETLVKLVWKITGVSDGERELFLKEFLWEMEKLQEKIQDVSSRWESSERISGEENDLLRSLLGTKDNELRARVVALGEELRQARQDLIFVQDEAEAMRVKTRSVTESNDTLRDKLKNTENQLEALRNQRLHEWQNQLSGFSEEHLALQGQMDRLNNELDKVQSLMKTQSEELTKEKQFELEKQQQELFGEMEQALRQKEDLLWAQEEIFARGVAQKLRGELQSATGRLQLTLEKFHLLEGPADPKPKTWEQWWRLLKAGPQELRTGFRETMGGLGQAVQTLEDYLLLTHRRETVTQELSLPDLIRQLISKLYQDHFDRGAIELFLPDVLPAIKGDQDLLERVLQALLDNALESLTKADGKVKMTVEKSPDDREVWVSVADTGQGLPSPQTGDVFQPFFTTKPGHRGLGLTRARRYAEWHRGRLECVESHDQGSVFRMVLPL